MKFYPKRTRAESKVGINAIVALGGSPPLLLMALGACGVGGPIKLTGPV